MSVTDVLKVLSKIGLRSSIRDDDYIDQLNHFFTPNLLLITAAATYLKQYLGDPIHCWTPAEYKDKDTYQPYVDQYCWIHDMYNVPFEDEMPVEQSDREKNLVGFYRWVSVALLLQALLFKLPNLLWISWKNVSGLDIDSIIKMIESVEIGKEDDDTFEVENTSKDKEEGGAKNDKKSKKKKDGNKHKMAAIAEFINRRLELTHRRRRSCGRFSNINILSKNSGNYITYFFCFNKLLYVTVILIQFFLLSKFLDINFFTYGSKVVQDVQQWDDWEDSSVFPRIAWCDFQIRQLQNVHTYTVQCVLSMNIFIEKIYAIQWFWLMFLLVITIIGVIQTFIAKLSFSKRLRFVQSYFTVGLNASLWPPPGPGSQQTNGNDATPRHIVRQMSRNKLIQMVQQKSFIRVFVRDYLKADGVFLLKSIHDNTSNASAMNIMFRLLDHYLTTNRLITK